MKAPLTSKGKAWEYRNSLWMLWTLLTLGFLNYVSFFYIARKVKQKKWFRAGIVYSVFFIIFVLAPDDFTGIFLISWAVSIFHVFKVRTEYLLRLEAIQALGLENRELSKLREIISKEYDRPEENRVISSVSIAEQGSISHQEHRGKKEASKPVGKNEENKKVDINSATEQEIAEIPGIGSIFASKIIAVRSQENGFDSFNQFIELLSVKPHLAEKIKSYIVFSKVNSIENRVKKTEGRIVDF